MSKISFKKVFKKTLKTSKQFSKSEAFPSNSLVFFDLYVRVIKRVWRCVGEK